MSKATDTQFILPFFWTHSKIYLLSKIVEFKKGAPLKKLNLTFFKQKITKKFNFFFFNLRKSQFFTNLSHE